MPAPFSVTRRRLLRISAGTVAGASMGGPLIAAQSALQRTRRDLETHHFTTHALGAEVTLAIVHSDYFEAAEIAAQAIAEITRLERIFSLYLKHSSVVKLNTYGALEQPPAELLTVLSQTTSLWLATDGAFDPTVQPHWNTRHVAMEKQPAFSWRDVHYSTSGIEFNRPDMAITLNGIAQGYISEQVALLLRKNGLENVLVNVGEIVAVGNRSDGKPWQVGLAELQSDSAQYTLALTDSAIATSAPLSHVADTQAAAGHIIDPADGKPCRSPWRRLSVIHPSATIADGLSTGLVLKSGIGIQKAISHYPEAKVLATDLVGYDYQYIHSLQG